MRLAVLILRVERGHWRPRSVGRAGYQGVEVLVVDAMDGAFLFGISRDRFHGNFLHVIYGFIICIISYATLLGSKYGVLDREVKKPAYIARMDSISSSKCLVKKLKPPKLPSDETKT